MKKPKSARCRSRAPSENDPDAGPCPLSLVLPYRLAPTFGRDPLQTGARQMRRVRPPSQTRRLPLGGWALVGSRQEALARRTRQTTRAATPAVAVEWDRQDDARRP